MTSDNIGAFKRIQSALLEGKWAISLISTKNQTIIKIKLPVCKYLHQTVRKFAYGFHNMESLERFIEKVMYSRLVEIHKYVTHVGHNITRNSRLSTLNGTVNVLHFCTYLLDNLTPISRVYVSCGRVQFSVYVRLAKLAGPVIMFQPSNETTIQYCFWID